MTNHPKGRELCPELAKQFFVAIHNDDDGSPFIGMRLVESPDDMPKCICGSFLIVPCLVTPLLTATEREKLIGGEE